MPKIIEIGKYLFKLQLKMSGVFFLRHTVYDALSVQEFDYLHCLSSKFFAVQVHISDMT